MTLHHAAEVLKRIKLDLAHAFPGYADFLSDLLERQATITVQSKAAFHNRALLVVQFEHPAVENGMHALSLRALRWFCLAARRQGFEGPAFLARPAAAG